MVFNCGSALAAHAVFVMCLLWALWQALTARLCDSEHLQSDSTWFMLHVNLQSKGCLRVHSIIQVTKQAGALLVTGK